MIEALALRTPTIPPATHTNCYKVGRTIIDPASPYPDEQARLAAWAGPVERILITHHHGDHVGGIAALVAATGAEVWAHHDARLDVPVDRRIGDDERIDTGAGVLRALHTPGHADGHLAFHLEGTDAVICGDLVASVGTIVLIEPEGDLGKYLDSLARVRALVGTLYPAHGAPIPEGPEHIDAYVAHRHMRTQQFLDALATGPTDPEGIAMRVYDGIPGVNLALAALQVRTHLPWMLARGMVTRVDGTTWARAE